MVASGIQEIILIAQDTVSYGTDLYGKSQLFELLHEIDTVPGDFTYRLLYLYPDLLSIQNLQQLAKSKKFIPYFDIPLQHISSPLLKRMGRFYNEEKIYELLQYIKKHFPTHLIRTNFIIGFPGETEQDHEKLLAFITEGRCDNIALFEYHDEPLAASSKLEQKVDDTTMRKRFTQARQLVNRQLLAREERRK
jgi:ribosomal protein S12 methylthiotransferase